MVPVFISCFILLAAWCAWIHLDFANHCEFAALQRKADQGLFESLIAFGKAQQVELDELRAALQKLQDATFGGPFPERSLAEEFIVRHLGNANRIDRLETAFAKRFGLSVEEIVK